MKGIKTSFLVLAMASAAFILALSGCDDGSSSGGNSDITWTAVQEGGASGTADSTGIKITFSAAMNGLTLEDIAVTGAAAKSGGALAGSGANWTVPISVTSQGNASVTVSKTGVAGNARTIPVYKQSSQTPGGQEPGQQEPNSTLLYSEGEKLLKGYADWFNFLDRSMVALYLIDPVAMGPHANLMKTVRTTLPYFDTLTEEVVQNELTHLEPELNAATMAVLENISGIINRLEGFEEEGQEYIDTIKETLSRLEANKVFDSANNTKATEIVNSSWWKAL